MLLLRHHPAKVEDLQPRTRIKAPEGLFPAPGKFDARDPDPFSEEVYEPFLVQNGFLQRTARGRVATPMAYRHFGYTPPAQRADAVSQESFL